MKQKSLYDVLGVSSSADASTLKKAYRRLAKTHHPDVNPGDTVAEAKFKEISAAYDVLSDKEKRALYDQFGDVALSPGFDAEQARAHQQWQANSQGYANPFGQSSGGFGGFEPGAFGGDDLWSELFGFGRQAPRGPRSKGQNLRSEVHIDFETAALGGQRTLQFGPDHSFDVRIPAGVQDGETLRLKGQGQPAATGGQAGDLLLKVHVSKHAVFRREGLDLHRTLVLTVPEAVLGTTVSLKTLNGMVSLKVPPRTSSGKSLRLKGRGISRKGKGTGNLYVHIEVKMPDRITQEVEDAMAVLAAHYDASEPLHEGARAAG